MNLMKTIFLTIMLVFASAFQLFAGDGHTPDFRIINAGLGKQFAVAIYELEVAKATFEVQTLDGRVLLTKTIIGADYQGLFSLEHLREGRYQIVLRTETQEIVQPIKLTRRAIFYDLSNRTTQYMPEVSTSGKQLAIALHNPQAQPVSVRLLNEDGQVLYEKEQEVATEVAVRLDLQQVPNGDYTVLVGTPQRDWSKRIRL